jgi:hypothetical protein
MTVTEVEQNRWLRCQLNRGMFGDEVAVTYPATGSKLCSVFVPRTEVRVEGDNERIGVVRVKVLRFDGPHVVAVLPTDESTLVAVKEDDLSESA